MRIKLTRFLLGVALGIGVVAQTLAYSGPTQQYLSFGADYSRDRYSSYTTAWDVPYPSPTIFANMASYSSPVEYGGTVYMQGWRPVGGGKDEGLVYALNWTAVQNNAAPAIEAGQPIPSSAMTNAELWGGQPVVLSPVPDASAKAVGGVSISPDGRFLAVGWAGDIFVWPRNAMPDSYGHVAGMQEISLPDTGGGNPVNVSDSPAFFQRADGSLWIACGSWSGGLRAAELVGGNWMPAKYYLTTQTDHDATGAAITSSPSWDALAGLLVFGINNIDSTSDNHHGWVEVFDPTNGAERAIGYGTIGAPVDSSVALSQTGQSLFVPDRLGTVYWYDIGGELNHVIDPGTGNSWDISDLAYAPKGNGGQLMWTNSAQKTLSLASINGGNMTVKRIPYSQMLAYGSRGTIGDVISPSITENHGGWTLFPNTVIAAMAADFSGGVTGGLGIGDLQTDQMYFSGLPDGETTAAFVSAVPFTDGGFGLWTNEGLQLWVPEPYVIALSLSPSSTTPGGNVSVTITVPQMDFSKSVTLNWPGLGEVPIAEYGNPDPTSQQEYGLTTNLGGVFSYWRTYTLTLPAPGTSGTYTATATANVPGEPNPNPSASATLTVTPPPPPPPPPTGGTGTLTFDPGSSDKIDPATGRPYPSAKWDGWITATLIVPRPSMPGLDSWGISPPTITYPKQADHWAFGNPKEPTDTVSEPMTPTGNAQGATDRIHEIWSNDGSIGTDIITNQPFPPRQSYPAWADYSGKAYYHWYDALGNIHYGSISFSGTATGSIDVDGTTWYPHGVAGGGDANSLEGPPSQ